MSKESIPESLYAPSIPTASSATQSASTQGTSTSCTKQDVSTTTTSSSETAKVRAEAESTQSEVFVHISCCECVHKADLTPATVYVYLHYYFAKLIGRRKAQVKKTSRRKIKPLYSEEALTENEIYERLKEENRQSRKRQSKRHRRRKNSYRERQNGQRQ